MKWSNWQLWEGIAPTACVQCFEIVKKGKAFIRFRRVEGENSPRKEVVCDEICAADHRVKLGEIEGSPETI
jgi:hypothetical protein